MNKDLDERIVPVGEYRDALNVEVSTSEDSNIGTLQTIKGNLFLQGQTWMDGVCVGSIANHKNDKLYFLVARKEYREGNDLIVEYDDASKLFAPVFVDTMSVLQFDKTRLITGINIIDDTLFWTDNHSEPKRINISRGKAGCLTNGASDFATHTRLMIKNKSGNSTYIEALDSEGNIVNMQEKHLTVIRQGPSTAPVLEMIDTERLDEDGDKEIGGTEIHRPVNLAPGQQWMGSEGDFVQEIIINVSSDTDGDAGGSDFLAGDIINIYSVSDNTVKVRLEIISQASFTTYTCRILAGDKNITADSDYMVELEQPDAIFEFKLPRFACRYKYEDGEYSPYSPFTQPAFLPGPYAYLPKEGYNLGMVNRVRKLAIKNFVHTRSLPEDVVSIDILYKESNSPNVYSVKTIKKREFNANKWDEWNAVSRTNVISGPTQVGDGWTNKTKGYLPITSEMIHAVLPENQLLRPWDNVPRKALAQEVVGNRLVYGNYLQNYNLTNASKNEKNIKVDLQAGIRVWDVGGISPEEVQAGPNMKPKDYNPAKSIKTLRTYQLGVVYIDKYGRETPVFSEDKIGEVIPGEASTASFYNPKTNSDKKTSIRAELKNNPPDWATHFKYFVKETSNEYYNLAMDRWYNAEDGNIWISFPSSERNKLEEGMFINLKKEHDSNTAVKEKARYKVLAISNEAPRYIKLKNISIGSATDDGKTKFGNAQEGFPLVGQNFFTVTTSDFEEAGWKKKLFEESIRQTYIRFRVSTDVSRWYEIKDVSFRGADYKITVTEGFKDDMSFTSPDGTYLNGVDNLILDVVRREEVNKAEFDGRFFAKILKDLILIKYLNINLESSIAYTTIASVPVQYINPQAIQAENAWNGFGYKNISVDSKQHWAFDEKLTPFGMPNGDGVEFWERASDSRGDFKSSDGISTSSGWFIDKVEGFRPFKGSFGKNKYSGFYWDPGEPGSWWSSITFDFWDAFELVVDIDLNDRALGGWGGQPEKGIVNAMGLNAYGNTGLNYLNCPDMKAPNDTDWNESLIGGVSKDSGGRVARPVGIDREASIINISYSGIGSKREGSWKEYSLSSNNNNNLGNGLTSHAFTETEHELDIVFIEQLTTPGTLWRWKEDPGKVLYRTVENYSLPANSGPNISYNQDQWSLETSAAGDFDGQQGVFLFNYAVFSDYLLSCHHKRRVRAYTGCDTHYTDWNCKPDFVSRGINDHTEQAAWPFSDGPCDCGWTIAGAACAAETAAEELLWFPGGLGAATLVNEGIVSLVDHGTSGASAASVASNPGTSQHHRWPMGIYDWNERQNKRRRFVFKAEVAFDDPDTGAIAGDPVGSVGPHYYLPTNDPNLPAHLDYKGDALTAHPITGTTYDQNSPAPGIRPDGMYTGYDQPGGQWSWHNGSQIKYEENIPLLKRFDGGSGNNQKQTAIPGSVTWEIREPFVEDVDGSAVFSSTNPAIWETEPKEDVGLDIYHEVGQIYPILLNNDTIEQFVGAINEDINKNSYVQCWGSAIPPGANQGTISLSTGSNTDIRVSAAYDKYIQLSDVDGIILGSDPSHTMPAIGTYLIFWRADGSTTEAYVRSISTDSLNNGAWFELSGNWLTGEVGVHNKMVTLPWFNCYSFGNGVESDRIRDDFNQVTIDNGPKASITLEEPYLEDRRKNGFIWSGIYNSTSGVNNLNQFIQAEAITKDVNPSYGSIQKLSVRDSDLVALCEDRVLQVLADKDALYNADGNTNVVSTNRVLGTARPFVGDYGISKNPESFASDSYRSYFTDTSRGAVIRLSQNGLTPISDAGMKDWFADNLPKYTTPNMKILGSFDDKKQEYNITFNVDEAKPVKIITQDENGDDISTTLQSTTLSYSESSKGWVSFKSFIKENGVSLNNSYYTFKKGKMYEHHVNEIRNNFYFDPSARILSSNPQFDSSVDVLFNQLPGVIKSFSTLNYEGSQSRITQDILTNPDYYDNVPKDGWYVREMVSNAQELGVMEFWDKEDKWFSQVKGVKTRWLDNGTAGNIDPREFSYQGIGNASGVSCIGYTPGTDYIPATPPTPEIPGTPGTPGTPGIPGTPAKGWSAAINMDGLVHCADHPPLPGMQPHSPGYATFNDLLAAAIIAFPNAGLTINDTINQFDSKLNQLFFGNISGSLSGQMSHCVPYPGTPDVPAVPAIPATPTIPATPGTPAVPATEPTITTIPCPDPIPSWNCIPGYFNTSYVGGSDEIPAGDPIPAVPDSYATNTCDQHTLIENTASSSGMFSSYDEFNEFVANAANGLYNVDLKYTVFCLEDLSGGAVADVISGASNECPCSSGGGILRSGMTINATYSIIFGPSVFPVAPGPQNLLATTGIYNNVLATLQQYAPNISAGDTWTDMQSKLYAAANPNSNQKGVVNINMSYTNCLCTDYTPGTPEIPGTPAVPAVPAIEENVWIPSYCEEVTTFPSNGEFSSLSLCEETCLVPQTWNCETAYPVGWPNTSNGMPTNYCVEVFDGSGSYTSIVDCEEGCPSWQSEEPIVITPFDPSGDSTPSWTCSGEGGMSMLDGTPVAPWTCFDPGNGSGMYTSLSNCQRDCSSPVIMVGPCDIAGATVYNNNTSYSTGDLVEFMGHYYYALSAIAAGSNSPSDMQSKWEACVPNTSGPCNIDAATIYDNSNAYSAGDIVEIQLYNGNPLWYYAISDVQAYSEHQPIGATSASNNAGYYGDIYDALSNTTNPWIPCDDNPTGYGCAIDNFSVYNDNVTYDLNNPSQLNQNGAIVVWHNNNFWELNCDLTINQMSGGFVNTTTYGNIAISNNTEDILEDGNMSCYISGITGIAPGQWLQDENGNDIPGTGYWQQCDQDGGGFVDAYQGCCDFFAQNSLGYQDGGYSLYGQQVIACWTDPLCNCNPSMCSGNSGTGCFAKGDKVEMFDGTLKAIELIKVGDEIKSIKNNKVVKGVVTDSLVHPTSDIVEVVKINGITSEPDHPVFVNGKWVAAKTLGNISNEFIDNWYNLEIDGNIEDSEHNYIIGGLVVSGLGDNVKLNSKYQRQPKRLTEYLNL